MATAPEPTAYSKLTEKQKGFVDALCLDPNISGRAAAIKAGYVEQSAHIEASRLLRSANIRKALGELLQNTAPTPNELAARWDRVSLATLDDFYSERTVMRPTKLQQSLHEAIALTEYQIQFEREYAQRSAELLGLTDQALSDYIENETRGEQQQRLKMLRWQMELESNPFATRTIDGPPEQVTELVLDLVKAQKAGVLDLAKSIKPTPHGLGVELRDPDAALDKLARMAGAYEKDNEQSKAVTVLNTKTEIINTGVPVARSESEVKGV